jgi:hypothetical protein
MIQLTLGATGTQLSFDGEHSYQPPPRPVAEGYIGRCACGWESRPMRNKRAAQGAVAGHMSAANKLGAS